jgi:AbiV family abortive infection protein
MEIMAKRLPDKSEAIKGAGVATATAASLLSGAALVADAGSYGIARSLAVLALEESVKARTLGAIAAVAAQGRNPGFSDDDLRKVVYSGHRERHAVGLVQHLAATFPDAMLGISVDTANTAKIGLARNMLARVGQARVELAAVGPPRSARRGRAEARRPPGGVRSQRYENL